MGRNIVRFHFNRQPGRTAFAWYFYFQDPVTRLRGTRGQDYRTLEVVVVKRPHRASFGGWSVAVWTGRRVFRGVVGRAVVTLPGTSSSSSSLPPPP
ncbi:hypothetical protein ACI65C_002046 [Semiaphis heraclei]